MADQRRTIVELAPAAASSATAMTAALKVGRGRRQPSIENGIAPIELPKLEVVDAGLKSDVDPTATAPPVVLNMAPKRRPTSCAPRSTSFSSTPSPRDPTSSECSATR